MPRKRSSSSLLAAALIATARLAGQSVHWDPPGGSLPVGEVSQIQLVFDDCTPDDTPAPPKVDGLTLDYQGQSTNMSLIGGTFSKNVSVTYAALLSRQQEVQVPEFSINTNKGRLRVPAARFTPSGATLGSSGVSLGDAASARMTPSAGTVWAGEVFSLRYTIEVGAGYNPSWGRGVFEWDPSPLVAEDWSPPEPFESRDNGPRAGLGYHTRAMAPTSGHIRLNPTSQLVNLSVGVTGFGFFQQRQYQQFSVPDGPVSMDVRPLPPAPQGFTGAVGDFRVTSKVVPNRVKVGEPVTWTVELSGSGNWPAIRGLPTREASSDFQVIQPKPKRTQPQGKLFDATLSEDVVLIPTKAGNYGLGSLDFTYFDPRSGSYRTITAPGAEVTVDPAAPAAPVASQVGAAPGAPSVTSESPAIEAKPPEPPAGALGDPVPASGSAAEPLRLRSVAGACAALLALLALFWGALAYGRAKRTDPLRPQREARQRLSATLRALSGAQPADRPALLLAWQRDSAVLWKIAHAAPQSQALPESQWAALWTEADRSLYSTDSSLPPDWTSRAQEAFDKMRIRPFNPARLLLARNLFPAVVLVLAPWVPSLHAADPALAYRAGNFTAAAAGWSGLIAADPLDWSARHNLSLALSQQDRWGEAAAQASAAFVQMPRDPAVRRQLALACEKASFIPQPLDFLLQSGPVQDLARRASPGEWQRVGLAAAALSAAALALLLARAYGMPKGAWIVPATVTVLALCAVVGAASLVGYRAYGIAADTRSVVVWRAGTLRSVPTEADISQKTTPLAAGSAAIADKAFLGWIRLSFPDGQTGWIPRAEAVYLWRSNGG